ncbi:hypothetical protein [Microvirga antarctica]|uniref:hypothetical protein n=1 Tax=Microvirga antarctica TaxID=2819233 RepID=UPI001B316DDB|nr:hypothetical protein [Microvirga antarctica]
MVQITNNSRQTLTYVVGGTRANPELASIAPGETETLSIDPNDATLRGQRHAGVISIDARRPPRPRKDQAPQEPDPAA